MSTQQINLYQPMFRREKKIFSAAAMLQLGTVFMLGLMAYYAVWYLEAEGSAKEVAQLEKTRGVREQALLRLVKQFPARPASQLLADEVARIKEELAERDRLAQALAQGDFGRTTGFGDYLEALARQHVDGTWLRQISIEQGGRSIAVTGSTVAPDLVPRFIQRLSDEPVFAGASFNVLTLARPVAEADSAAPPDRIDFVLRTESAE